MDKRKIHRMSNEITIGKGNEVAASASQSFSLIQVRTDKVQFPRLYSYPKDKLLAELSRLITKAFIYKGQQSDPTNSAFIAEALYEEMLEDSEGLFLMNLTLFEIDRAFRKSCLGINGEMYGVSVSSLYQSIVKYVDEEGALVQRKVNAEESERKRKQIENSPVGQMIAAYAGQMTNKK